MVVAGTHVAKVGIALSLSVFGVFGVFVMFAVFVVVVVVAVEPKQWKEARKTVLRLPGCRCRRRRCCVGPYRPWRRAMLVPSCCIRRGQGGRARPRNVQRGGLARVGGLGSIGAW